MYNTISEHMESLITVCVILPHFRNRNSTGTVQNACDDLFVQYNARENIDILHAVVTEARERQKAGGQPGSDTWRPNLAPRTAVRARTIPILRQEKAALEAQLAQVRERADSWTCLVLSCCSKLEEENLNLQSEIAQNVEAMDINDAGEKRRLDLLDEVIFNP